MAHTYGKIDVSDINFDGVANSALWGALHTHKAYSSSKLMNVLHAIELNNRYEHGKGSAFKAVYKFIFNEALSIQE